MWQHPELPTDGRENTPVCLQILKVKLKIYAKHITMAPCLPTQRVSIDKAKKMKNNQNVYITLKQDHNGYKRMLFLDKYMQRKYKAKQSFHPYL